jgi:hypothetical protein
MVSFRKKVLDALDISKEHVRIPVYQNFLNPDESAAAVVTEADESCKIADATGAVNVLDYKPYAVSKCIKSQTIGPRNRVERLEVLGFVVGDDPGTATMLPDAINRPKPGDTVAESIPYTGIHFLGGLYDSSNKKLALMRKSAVKDDTMQTMYQGGVIPGSTVSGAVIEHTHTDWPATLTDQTILLNEDPMADALYYHKTQVRFLLTGIDDVATTGSDQASNHRGTVRMLVLRPRTPAVRTRVDGTSNEFIINHDFMPNWDTQLFYDNGKQMGGKLDELSWPHTEKLENLEGGTGQSTNVTAAYNIQPDGNSKYSSDVVTYGLKYAENPARYVDKSPTSTTFGHMKPSYHLPGATIGTDETHMIEHGLTATDLLMSRINKQKFAVLHDEVFTLDSLHHGAAAQHIANVTIPYYKKVKFAGRLQQGTTDNLSYHTNDEPMNMSSRPIILFLSYNQKISASVEGWTAISEV